MIDTRIKIADGIARDTKYFIKHHQSRPGDIRRHLSSLSEFSADVFSDPQRMDMVYANKWKLAWPPMNKPEPNSTSKTLYIPEETKVSFERYWSTGPGLPLYIEWNYNYDRNGRRFYNLEQDGPSRKHFGPFSIPGENQGPIDPWVHEYVSEDMCVFRRDDRTTIVWFPDSET